LGTSKYYEIGRLLNVKACFCDSFKSWQKGKVENMNKLIRQYLPRNTDMSNTSRRNISLIQEKK
jgi:IS30 family transposase